MVVVKTTKDWLLLLVMLQVHRTTGSNSVEEPCETESPYTLYFTAPAVWANTTHRHTCLYSAAVDEESSSLVRPSMVGCPSLLWPQVRQVRSLSYDAGTRTTLLHLAGYDDSRFTLVSARTCPSSAGNVSNFTNKDDVTSRGPIQVEFIRGARRLLTRGPIYKISKENPKFSISFS